MPSSLLSIFKSRLKFLRLTFSKFVSFNSAKWPVMPSTSEVAILAITDSTSGAISTLPNFEFE